MIPERNTTTLEEESRLLSSKRVLVIEDNKGLNLLAQKVLRRAGFETEGVFTGSDALDRIANDPNFTLLVDQQLPDMKGTELIGSLIQRNHTVPFVAMTGNGDESVAIEMMKLGARDYLIKEFGFTDLLPEVFQHISRELETANRLKIAEESLRKSEERFKLTMDANQDGIWDWNITTDEVYFSPSCSSILGFTSDELQLDITVWNNLIHPDDKNTVSVFYKTCIEECNDNFQVEYRVRGKEDKWVWILGRGKVVTRKDSGQATRMVGTLTDISRIKASDAKLQRQTEHLKSIFNSTPNILLLVDEDTQVQKINQKGILFSGRQEEEIIGHLGGEVFRCVHSFNGQGCGTTPHCLFCSVKTRIDNTFQTGIPHQEEEGDLTVLVNNVKTTFHMLISTVLLTLGDSKSVLLTLTNITDFKRAESERYALEKQLHHSQKMQSIGTLAGGIAHDFNNILTVILGYSQLAIRDDKKDMPVHQHLEKVVKAGIRAKELVQQILTFSRQSDSKRISLQPGIIVEEVINMLRPSLPSTIEIKHHEDHPTGYILADPTQLHQILINLCTNAFHAMENNGGTLNISLSETSINERDILYKNNVKVGKYIQFSVGDTGHGIDKKSIDKIFDPYFTTKKIGKGTGLGLAIVHGIVLSYGGCISVDSELGEGTTFHVYLPIIDEEPVLENVKNDQVLRGNENILIIDDEKDIADMYKIMLEKIGYNITVQNNSLDALEMFKNQHSQFDLVITDQTMPNMTGSDLAKTFLQVRPDIPIILCTGYSSIINDQKAKKIGIKEFVSKPVSKNTMTTLIRKLLDT